MEATAGAATYAAGGDVADIPVAAGGGAVAGLGLAVAAASAAAATTIGAVATSIGLAHHLFEQGVEEAVGGMCEFVAPPQVDPMCQGAGVLGGAAAEQWRENTGTTAGYRQFVRPEIGPRP